MRRVPVVLAGLAAALAVVVPCAPIPVPPSVVPLLAVLLAAPVVLVVGRAGHRAALRAVRGGVLDADVLTSAGTLAALAWSVPAAVAALHPTGPGAVPDLPPVGTALLPGAAAVLTVVAAAVRRAGPGSRVAAERWCARLGPVALLGAVAVAGFRTGIGQPATAAVPAGIAVLLAACPVALTAAVPAAVRAAGRAGGAAVRLPPPAGSGRRDPVGWSAPSRPATVDRVDTVALSGPDVLTGHGPAAVAVHPAEGTDPELVLWLAASVAGGAAPGSDLTPAARALRAAAGACPDVAEPDERPGLGVSGLVAELVPARDAPGAGGPPAGSTVLDTTAATGTVVAHAVLLGAPDWLLDHGIGLPPEVSRARERAEAEGRAVLALAWDGVARAVLALARSPHPGAVAGIDALRAAGTEPVLLTPDDDGPARALGSAAGLDPADPDAIRPGLDAAGRAAAVAGLQVRGRTVAVAADPGSDPAALAGADLPVALTPPDTPAGAGWLVVLGGPAEVAGALVLARRARRAAAAGLRTALAASGIAVAAAAAGLPAAPAAGVPVVATGVVLAVVRWRLR